MRYPLITVMSLCMCNSVWSDSTLQFQVKDLTKPKAPVQTQTVYVKDGRILIKAAGGDNRIDLLFNNTDKTMIIVDHAKRTYMPLDEQRVGQLVERAEGLMSTVQEQLANLPPEQRAQLEQLLGNSNLGGIAQGKSAPPPPKKYIKVGMREVHKIRCQGVEVIEGGTKIAELCLAGPSAIGIPNQDFETVKAFQLFGERLARHASKLAEQFGARVPEFGNQKLAGLPVELKDLSSNAHMEMSIARVATNAIAAKAMEIPADYSAEQLPSL